VIAAGNENVIPSLEMLTGKTLGVYWKNGIIKQMGTGKGNATKSVYYPL
jgi:hypothetical protein